MQQDPDQSRPVSRSSLRILLVAEASAKGTGKHVLDLAEGLIARGCDVHVLYSPVRMDEIFRTRVESMPGLTHRQLRMHRSIHPSDAIAVWAVRRYLRKFGPFDVIHGHSSKGGAVARLAAIGSGLPAIYTPHALIMMTPTLSAAKRRFYSSIEFVLSKLSRHIIAVSPAEARLAVATGLGEGRILTIPNGVGPPQLSPRDEARRVCGFGTDEIVIGSVGRLVENKAPDVLVNALAIALRTCPKLRVVFVGDGPSKATLAELSSRLGIADKVILLGELDARKVFAGFDIFGMSSRMEAMPYVVLEAMSAGLPIMATITSGVEILVEEGVNGLVVPMDDCDAFAAGLVKLAEDPALMGRMADASRQLIRQFTSERMIERILALYESCADVGNARSEPKLAVDAE